MKADNLLPGDTFCCLGLDALGKVISWGEWTGKSKEGLEYSHVEGYFGRITQTQLDVISARGDEQLQRLVNGFLHANDATVARMNPPYSQLYDLDALPAERVKIGRLDMTPMIFGPDCPVPRFPGEDVEFQRVWMQEVLDNLGEFYAYEQILGDLLERVGTWLSPHAVQDYQTCHSLVQDFDAMLGRHTEVCSEWWRQRVNGAMRSCYKLDGFELLEGVGYGQARPADYTNSRWLNFDLVKAIA